MGEKAFLTSLSAIIYAEIRLTTIILKPVKLLLNNDNVVHTSDVSGAAVAAKRYRACTNVITLVKTQMPMVSRTADKVVASVS